MKMTHDMMSFQPSRPRHTPWVTSAEPVLVAMLMTLSLLVSPLALSAQTPEAVVRVPRLMIDLSCAGVDDTAALRAAIATADTRPFRPVQLPAQACVFTDTLVVGGRTDRYSEVSLVGHSEYTSALVYAGPMDRPAMLISHMAAFSWRAFSLSSPTVTNVASRGTAIGIQLDGPFGSGGTMNTGITFDHVFVSGFHIGMLAGGGDAASEVECRSCTFTYNNIGWTAGGYNSLNFWFYGLGIAHNVIGIKLGGPWVTDAPHIVGGGSSWNVVADFYAENSFGVLTVDHFRAEIAAGAKFLTGASSGGYPQQTSVRDSSIVGRTPDAVVIDVASLRMESSYVFGRLVAKAESCAATAGHQVITIEDSAMTPDPVTGWPVTFPTGTGLYRFRLFNNRPANWGTPSWLVDKSGTWICGVVE